MIDRPAARATKEPQFAMDYGREVETLLTWLTAEITTRAAVAAQAPSPRWLAIQIVERNEQIGARLQTVPSGADLLALAAPHIHSLETAYGDDIDILLAERRYAWIHEAAAQVIRTDRAPGATRTARLDALVTHRWLGIPLFLALMWLVFRLAIDVTAPYVDWIDAVLTGPVARWTTTFLTWLGLGNTWLASLAVDGILAGVGGVLAFVPVLMAIYLILAVLEESGYMARAAFLMDRAMCVVGLHGKSFLPLLVGFGCTVPAIYATRTLENRRDRVLTGLLAPFMSCSARLPVYALLAAVFVPRFAGLAIFGLYLVGILAALGVGLLLRHTLPPASQESLFVLELPPYHLPGAGSVWHQTWRRTWSFLRKASTVILAVSVVVWVLMAIPVRPGVGTAPPAVDDSVFAAAAGAIGPLFRPLGFGTWQATGALLTGLVAKEVIVSTLAQTYGAPTAAAAAAPATHGAGLTTDLMDIGSRFGAATMEAAGAVPRVVGIGVASAPPDAPQAALVSAIDRGFAAASGGHAALAGLAFMVFVLLYTPCVATLTALRQELGARWMWVSILGQLAVAWTAAFVVFQGGVLLGF